MTEFSSKLLVVLFKLLSLLPLSFTRGLGSLVGRWMYWRKTQATRVSEENLRLCLPELDDESRRQLLQQRMRQLGIMAMELPAIWSWPNARVLALVGEIHGKELLQRARDEGCGVVVIAPHTGNWEVLGLYIAQHFEATSMYQPPNVRAMNSLMRSARARTGARLVPTDASGVKALLKALKRGELACVLPDQSPPLGSGEFAPFFGLPALTMTMVHKLVRRTGAKVLVSCALRNAEGKFDIHFWEAEPAIYSDEQQTSLVALNREVERCVCMDPKQYQWEYKRFRKQPDGSRPYYRH